MSFSSTALREEGNKLYKKGNFKDAIFKYNAAISLDPADPAPVRTLSSAQFELGEYSACLATIDKALALEKDETKLPGLKLRKAKCHYHLRQFSEAKEVLEAPGAGDADAINMKKAIEQFGTTSIATNGDEKKQTLEAILRLPRFRSSLHPGSLEYFPRGHDDPRAAFDDETLEKLATTGKGDIDISVLYGGVGDGRHLFQQLSHINGFFTRRIEKHYKAQDAAKEEAAAKGLPEPETKDPYGTLDFYLAAQDAKSHAVARILIMLKLLDDLGLCLTPDKEESIEKRVTIATLCYVYLCDIMPPYCRERLDKAMKDLLDAAKDLEKSNFGLKFLEIDDQSKEAICEVLEWWLSNCKGMPVPGGEPSVELARGLPIDPNSKKVDEMLKILEGIEEENSLFEDTRMLFPFKSLMHEKEPALEALLEKTEGPKKKRKRLTELKTYASINWKVNPTLLQELDWYKFWNKRPSHSVSFLEQASKIFENGYKRYKPEFFFTRPESEWKKNPMESRWSMIQVILPWFSSMAGTLRIPDVDLTINLCVSDITAQLDRIQYTTDRKFDAIYLSNVPDYTGGHLTTVLHALPALKANSANSGTPGYALQNCLANPGAFKEGLPRFYTEYLVIPSEEKVKQYLGLVRSLPVSEKAMEEMQQSMGMPAWLAFTDPQKYIYSPPSLFGPALDKAGVTKWLYSLFFKIAMPTMRDMMHDVIHRVNQPCTLFHWIRVLIYIVEVQKFPPHWVGSVVDSILAGSLVTGCGPAVTAPMHILELKSRDTSPTNKWDLRPFLPELRVLLRKFSPVLPFTLIKQAQIPTEDNIAKWRLQMEFTDWSIGPNGNMLSLAFFRPEVGPKVWAKNGKWFMDYIKERAEFEEGDDVGRSIILGGFQWQLEKYSEEMLASRKRPGVAEWEMERDLMAKMKKEGWKMGIIRTDVYGLVSKVYQTAKVKEVTE
ncbi:hypothetical protein BJ508DRAFT_411522 [Ascobolus immersus RN42]|uniref:Uncharacterized protein n=1 Tax=Ascobolus immersus RN42 TaxID=1160509 RepID=A0A3N4IL28_ASCIM|nr:hypothetical protein BJ508DRAFT_411522 [Ascobolus immersus RN42]